jgi:hypothetical protein
MDVKISKAYNTLPHPTTIDNTLQQLPAYPQSPSAFIGVHQWLIKRNSRYSSIPATCTERSERIRVKTSMTRKLPFIIYP